MLLPISERRIGLRRREVSRSISWKARGSKRQLTGGKYRCHAKFAYRIRSAPEDEQPPLEPFGEVQAGEFNEAVMYNEGIIKSVQKRRLPSQNPLPILDNAVLFFVKKIAEYKNLKFSRNITYHAKTSGPIVAGAVMVRAVLEDW